jgi:SAM-dependent methyltransferase
MRKQQQIWHDEHNSQRTLPSMAKVKPASHVVRYTDYLKKHGIPLSGRAVDIGSGKGRHSIHLAMLGFEVYAIEYIEPAIKVAQQLAKHKGVADKIHFEVASIDSPWRIADNYFDAAIDSFASIEIETREGREVCRDEMFRTLRPGGYALITANSIDDEWERRLIANYPGGEPNSTIWPQNGKFQKDYDEKELREFYHDFEIVDLKKIHKLASRFGQECNATDFWMVVRKPA